MLSILIETKLPSSAGDAVVRFPCNNLTCGEESWDGFFGVDVISLNEEVIAAHF
jgi:hypothetical protein